jgi:hypothetical protein
LNDANLYRPEAVRAFVFGRCKQGWYCARPSLHLKLAAQSDFRAIRGDVPVPIHIRSLEAGGVLHYRFAGRITAKDLNDLTAAEDAYFRALSQDECLSIIADFSELETVSPELFLQFQQMRLFSDARVCWVVIVAANPYLRALAISLGVITQHRRFTFRDSYDEGLRVLGLSSNGRNGRQALGKQA